METTTVFRSLFLLLSLQLIVHEGVARPLDPISESGRAARLAELQAPPLMGPAIESTPQEDSHCWYSTVTLPFIDPNTGLRNDVSVSVSHPDGKNAYPVTLIVPTIEGRTILETRTANILCKNRIAGIIADVNTNKFDGEMPAWGIEDANHRRAIQSIRTVIDWLQTDRRFDRNKIGLVGYSLGGITASMLVGVENRITATVIGAGAGNLPEVMAFSGHSRIVNLRNNRMKYLGLETQDEYEAALREKLRYDPLHFAKAVGRDRVMMMVVNGDTSVPGVCQRELWTTVGEPDSLFFKRGGHVTSLVRLVFLKMGDIVSFLHHRFGTQDPGEYDVRYPTKAELKLLPPLD